MRILATLFMIVAVAAPGGVIQAPMSDGLTPTQQLFVLKELKPDLKTVGILWNEAAVKKEELLPQVQKAGAAAGVKVVVFDVQSLKDIATGYRALTGDYKVQALWVIADDDVVGANTSRNFLIQNAIKSGLPILAPSSSWIKEGALVALKRESGSVQLMVNEKAAAALKISIPEKYAATTQYLAAN